MRTLLDDTQNQIISDTIPTCKVSTQDLIPKHSRCFDRRATTQRQYCLDSNCCTVTIDAVLKGGQEVKQENSSGMGDVKGFGDKN